MKTRLIIALSAITLIIYIPNIVSAEKFELKTTKDQEAHEMVEGEIEKETTNESKTEAPDKVLIQSEIESDMEDTEAKEDSENSTNKMYEKEKEGNDKAKVDVSNDLKDKSESVLTVQVLKAGVRDDRVTELKLNLERIGFPVSSNPTNYYGSITERVVKEFQEYYKVSGDKLGEAGPKTLAVIEEILNSPLQNGKHDDRTPKLKKDLERLGFKVSNQHTTYFGSTTEKRVRELQLHYKLKANGIADKPTLELIEKQLNIPMHNGLYRDDVIDLKLNLERIGFPVSSNPTNYYGSITERVVKEFQEYYKVSGDKLGEAGPKTLAVIEEILNSPLQNGKHDDRTPKLKKDLERLGFKVSNQHTTYFGSTTEKRVREFQLHYKLKANGIADKPTLELIEKQLNIPMYNGLYRDDVIDLKLNLEKIGFPVSSNPTNYYGSITERVVKEFQEYYKVTGDKLGEAGPKTLAVIEEILNNPLQNGKHDDRTPKLKRDLERLGFKVSNQHTTYFGSTTEEKVVEFQMYYGLKVNKIADKITLSKIEEVLHSPFQYGKRYDKIIELKKDLAQLGYYISSNPTPYYGEKTEQQVKNFQKDFGLAVNGIADEVTLAKIKEALAGRVKTQYKISLDQALEIQMKVNPQIDSKYAWVSKSYIKGNRVDATALNVRKGPGTKYDSLGTLSNGTEVKVIGEYNGWYAIEYNHNTWVSALPSDVLYNLNPLNFINEKRQQFQFLDLSKPSGASAKDLNGFLEGKGKLEGQGQAFIDAGRKHGINDVYLISHALLETGNGTSKLATGIKHKGVTVYNMFGIGAVDSCPEKCGAERAFKEGWTTPEKAIIGGAAFIGNRYIKAGQNTLYKMRWNPDSMVNGSASHQYATDVGWASKQVNTMYNLYEQIESFKLQLDIPQYK